MSIWIRWTARGAAALLALVVLAVLGAATVSEAMIRRPWPKAPVAISAAQDLEAATRGRVLAYRYGCIDCHGADLTGRLFFDEMPVARIWAPNLTLAAAAQSDADLARAIRAGVAADGRSLWVMPSEAFAHLSPAETADLIAFIRSKPVRGELRPAKQVGVVGRIGMLAGKFKPAPQLLADGARAEPVDLGPHFAAGRQLTRTCMECHGADLKGRADLGAPDLAVAAAYELDDFGRLLRTGEAAGGRRLGLMSEIAPSRFGGLSDGEIAALHGYLSARAGL